MRFQAVVALLFLASCGGPDGESSSESTSAPERTPAPEEAVVAPIACPDFGTSPLLHVPSPDWREQ